MGTVKGDLHDIGKNLCIMMLRGAGFEVIDLGVDTSPDEFIDAVEEHSPLVLGMSALLTTTMPNMGKTIDAFIDADLRDEVKIMVGGAPVTPGVRRRHGRRRLRQGRDGVRGAGEAAGGSRRAVPEPLDQEAYQHRLDRLSEMFGSMMETVEDLSTKRCPYKNRHDHCTANFGCRNQRKPPVKGERVHLRRRRQAGLPQCLGSPLSAGRAARPRRRARRSSTRRDELALQVPTSCRRTGRCRECVVEVTAGRRAPVADRGRRPSCAPPFRLACQAELESTRGAQVEFAVVRRRLRIVTPEPERAHRPDRPDGARRTTASCTGATSAIEHAARRACYGLAIDVGTTTVVLELVDLQSGRTLELVALENPQRFGGSDVMNRISYDSGPGRGELRHSLRKALNHELRALYARHGHRPPRGLRDRGRRQLDDARPLLRPRRGADRRAALQVDDRARAARGRRVTAPSWWRSPTSSGSGRTRRRASGARPLIAGHVGADVAADLLAVGLDEHAATA